ncbi:unnamed protein product, partial [Symbiodinium necroappetens]
MPNSLSTRLDQDFLNLIPRDVIAAHTQRLLDPLRNERGEHLVAATAVLFATMVERYGGSPEGLYEFGKKVLHHQEDFHKKGNDQLEALRDFKQRLQLQHLNGDPMATTFHISPIGEFQYPWVNKPDTKFNDDGLYSVDLILDGQDAAKLKAKIDGAAESYLNEHTDEMKPAQAKQWELYVPYNDELDEETGEPTGRTIFHFKQNAKIILKDGSTKIVKIEIRDAGDNIINKQVFGGSEGRVLFSMRGIAVSSSKKAGVRLDFAKVQVTQLIQGSAGSRGFGAVEGGYVADGEDQGFGGADGDESGVAAHVVTGGSDPVAYVAAGLALIAAFISIRHGFRSGLEETNARHLEALGQKVRFEELKIPYIVPETRRTYSPDFILDNGIIIETKGKLEPKDRAKHLFIKTQHPDLDIRFVFQRPHDKINKGSPTSYAMWADKYGFKWASRIIPEAWTKGITLNGPIFGAVMTALLVALIVGFIIGAILTGGLLIPLVAFLAFLGIILTFAFYALRAFYHWAWDQGLKMGLLDIGYHFIIERDATVVETRDRHLIGTHTPGHNLDSIGICLVGGRELGMEGGVNNFLKVQLDTLFDLIFNLRTEFGFLKLVGHSEVQKYRNRMLPDCPALEMDDLRQDLDFYTFNRKKLE